MGHNEYPPAPVVRPDHKLIPEPIWEIYELEVSAFTSGCWNWMAPGLCRLVKGPGDRNFRQGQHIEGFQHQFGKRYFLKVAERKFVNPPSDGPDSEIKLLEVLNTEPAALGEKFTVAVPVDATVGDFGAVKRHEVSQYLILYGTQKMTCTPTLCALLEDYENQKKAFNLELEYNGENQPLTMVSIAPPND